MLTTLPTVKSRLAIDQGDTQYDGLLTSAIKSLSVRFDKETNRTLARTENAAFEFETGDTELSVPCYPIESVSKFESKTSEANGWQEILPAPDFLIRSSCIISLPSAIFNLPSRSALARVSYTGGYVMPDSPDYPLSTIDHPHSTCPPISNRSPSNESPSGSRTASISA